MKLKEELAEKLAGIDCKDKIKEVMDERKDDIKKAYRLNFDKKEYNSFQFLDICC